MPKRGRRKTGRPRAASRAAPAGDRTRPGLPDPATVIEERTFVSPKGRRYRILRTTQMDPYDKPIRKGPRRKS